MPFGLGWPELVIILVIVLVIFGASRVPEIGRALGKGIREFRGSVSEVKEGVEGKATDSSAAEQEETKLSEGDITGTNTLFASSGEQEKAESTSDKPSA